MRKTLRFCAKYGFFAQMVVSIPASTSFPPAPLCLLPCCFPSCTCHTCETVYSRLHLLLGVFVSLACQQFVQSGLARCGGQLFVFGIGLDFLFRKLLSAVVPYVLLCLPLRECEQVWQGVRVGETIGSAPENDAQSRAFLRTSM